MDKVLVTGANGHIGNTLVKKLLGQGRLVRAMVRKTSNLAGLKDAQGQIIAGLELVFGDVLDRESLATALQGCSVIFHTAAVFKTRHVDEALMQRTAMEGARNLLELAAQLNPRPKIIYTSSVAAMGCTRRPEQILDESSWNTQPIDAYVASKAESEKLAHELATKLGLEVIYINPGTVLGPNDYGPTPSNAFILLAMKKGTPVYFNGGHSYTDVEDVAEGHLLAEKKGKPGERYILAGENISMEDALQRISKLSGKRKPFFKIGHIFVSLAGLGFETLAKLTGKPPLFTRKKAHQLIDYYGYFSSQKAVQELGYRFKNFDEILRRSKAWYQKQGWLAGC